MTIGALVRTTIAERGLELQPANGQGGRTIVLSRLYITSCNAWHELTNEEKTEASEQAQFRLVYMGDAALTKIKVSS